MIPRTTRPRRRKPVRRQSAKHTKVKVLDALWSKVVRQRAGHKCVACGAEKNLQGAHIMPKGAYPALRHDPANGLCLCWSCHLGPKGWHKHPMQWGQWCAAYLGGDLWRMLLLRSQTAHRPDREAIRLALEQELRGAA